MQTGYFVSTSIFLHVQKIWRQNYQQTKVRTRILIDHHQQPDTVNFEYGISNTAKSSTCEMVYDFIMESGNHDKINSDIAECFMQV